MNKQRLYNLFGVEMTSIEQMRFSKYLENEKIAMNTLQKFERTQVAKNWINFERLKQ